jgi:hypothetical protein
MGAQAGEAGAADAALNQHVALMERLAGDTLLSFRLGQSIDVIAGNYLITGIATSDHRLRAASIPAAEYTIALDTLRRAGVGQVGLLGSGTAAEDGDGNRSENEGKTAKNRLSGWHGGSSLVCVAILGSCLRGQKSLLTIVNIGAEDNTSHAN